MDKHLKILFLLIVSTTVTAVPTMDIQFGGALQNSCSFVDSNEVVEALESTLIVLNRIEEVENECQNILVNSKAFIQSSLQNTIALEDELTVSKNNENVIKKFIQDKISSGSSYEGDFDSELLTAQQEISLLKHKGHEKNFKIAQTMQLGITLFDDLRKSPMKCSHSFGRDLLSPTIAVTGRIFGSVDPGIGLMSGLLSSIIDYGSRVMADSRQSLKGLTDSKNFHLNYKCTMKNIEDIICGLEEDEKAIESAQNKMNEDNYLYEYMHKVLDFDTDDEDFRKFHHLKRHRYRISSILEDLENIYRSPETANDLKEVVSLQSAFTGLSLIPRLNPLKNRDYYLAMEAAGFPLPGSIDDYWDVWDTNQVAISSWLSNFYGETFYTIVNDNCSSIDTNEFPELSDIYNPNDSSCQTSKLRDNKIIKSYIKAVIVPALVFQQKEIIRLNDKIKQNANIHSFYTSIKDQLKESSNIDFNEYKLDELLELYKNHANKSLDSSLRLYGLDIIRIMDALKLLVDVEAVEPDVFILNPFNLTYDSFVEATKKAYAEVATVSNNGVSGGILYRSIIESKFTSYMDGVHNNFVFDKDVRLAQNYVSFNFHAGNLDELINKSEKMDSAGSSNLTIMEDVKSAFLATFGKTIIDNMQANIKRFKKTGRMKRELLHSCAIFVPQFETRNRKRFINGRTRTVLTGTSSVKNFCYDLIEQENGLNLLANSSEKFPLIIKDGDLTYRNKCYYKKYEQAVLRAKIVSGKKKKSRFRI